MRKGNVLVIGNSGVGKSTLINAVLGEEKATTGWGNSGTTDHLEIYENDEIPFRIIDSVGFEPSFFKKKKAIDAVKKWSKNSAKNGNEDSKIDIIWFCVEGTSRKLFPDTIKSLSSATAMWESVPVIVAITKSYSEPERKINVEMVQNAFAKQKRYSKNLKKVIPVVAQDYVINDSSYVEPVGITELIEATNNFLPEGKKAADDDIYHYKIKRKKALAQGIVGTATTAGSVIGAIPISVADAPLLSGIEAGEITALARLYEIPKGEKSKQLMGTIIEAGTASAAAKGAISVLKSIPGVNLVAGVLNAVIAGCFVAAIGEASIYIFEQVYLGKKTAEDIDWVTKVIESKLSTELIEGATSVIKKVTDKTDQKTIGKYIMEMFKSK
ncbi:GTP-binding protein [Ruminococcus sp. f11]|nr:GTPase [uncultured Blautia sp.]